MVFLRCALSAAVLRMAHGHLRRDSNESPLRAGNGTNEAIDPSEALPPRAIPRLDHHPRSATVQEAIDPSGGYASESITTFGSSSAFPEPCWDPSGGDDSESNTALDPSGGYASESNISAGSSSAPFTPCTRADGEDSEYGDVTEQARSDFRRRSVGYQNLVVLNKTWNSWYLTDRGSWTKKTLNKRVRLVLGVLSTRESGKYEEIITNTWWKRPGLCMITDGPSENCSVYTAFVHGIRKNAPKVNATDVLTLDVKEGMMSGKSFASFQYAANNYQWATHIGKMDLDTYPSLFELVESMDTDKQSESYIGQVIDHHGCGGHKNKRWFCPPEGCGYPRHRNFLDYAGGNDCWSYMQGALYIISLHLAQGATAPGTFWNGHRGTLSATDDVAAGRGINFYARSKNVSVETWDPHAWRHLR